MTCSELTRSETQAAGRVNQSEQTAARGEPLPYRHRRFRIG
jgi:hypothetical protein